MAMSQREKILDYCDRFGSITVREAFEKLFINSPTKRISELRQAGYDVSFTTEIRTNQQGETVNFKRYFIKRVVI